MSLIIILDAGPLGAVTNPKMTPNTAFAVQWMLDLESAGYRFIVPAVADFEIRRELLRLGYTAGLTRLDAFNAAELGRFLSITDETLMLGAQLWANSRKAGTPTADQKDLDADVLIAAQALELGLSPSEFVVATTNVKHFAQFVPCAFWKEIKP